MLRLAYVHSAHRARRAWCWTILAAVAAIA